MDKVSQSYWDEAYSGYQYGIANDEVTTWLNAHVNEHKGDIFEAGCYPGRYLAWFGKKGWTVSGMDLTPRMESDFKEWLKNNSISFSKIERGDVLKYMEDSIDRYDLVCSFGFIEHFENFEKVIALHTKILKPGGQLIITTPHFRGRIQKFLHSWLDSENLARHYVPSMNPELWKSTLEAQGLIVSWHGYFGNFDFWADRQKRSVFKRISLKGIQILTKLLRWLPNSQSYSPYCGIVAKKPIHN